MRQPTPCDCGSAPLSSRHLLLERTNPTTTLPRGILFKTHTGPDTWDSLTREDISLKELIKFMANTGLIQVRHIFTDHH